MTRRRPQVRSLMEGLESRTYMSGSHVAVTHALHNDYNPTPGTAVPAVTQKQMPPSALASLMARQERPAAASEADPMPPVGVYVIDPSMPLDLTEPMEVSPDGTTLGSPGAFGPINPSRIIYPYDVTNAQGNPALVYVSPLIPAVYLNAGHQYVIDSVGSPMQAWNAA